MEFITAIQLRVISGEMVIGYVQFGIYIQIGKCVPTNSFVGIKMQFERREIEKFGV
jgi:hypothetical protein